MTRTHPTQRGGWYHGWNIVAATVLAQVASNGLMINAFSLFLKSWSRDFGTPISTLQLGMAACGIGSALLAPLGGMMADKYPSRWLFGGGMAGIAVFGFGIGSATATWQYLLLYGLVAPLALTVCASVPGNAVISRWFVRRLGLALGISSFGLGLAGIVLPPILAAALPVFGWRAIWHFSAVITGLIVLPLVVWMLRDRPSERDGYAYLSADGVQRAPVHDAGGSAANPLRARDVLKNSNFWILVLTYLPMLALYGGAGQNIVPIATSRGVDEQAAGLLLSVYCSAQLAATLAGGMLSDRFGTKLPMAGLAFITAAGGVIVALGQDPLILGLGIACAGCGGAFWPLIAAAMAREFGAGGFGRAFGLAIFFLPIGVLAPFGVAKTQESIGTYAPPLLALAALTVLVGVLCLLFLKEKTGLVDATAEGLAGDGSPLPIG